ncbi:hypothetical protein C0J52_24638 [Blattella germanica]|nr:hypothetical protein C0J52_24638 [Blattella germanica]
MSENGYQPSFRSSHQREGTMDLYIETLTGTAFEMTVSPFDTVMSIKSKIQRVEGIPVSHQHLLYNLKELDDSACLIDYEIEDGATLKLVLSMRGGPISTRRLPQGEEYAWKELREFVENNREDMFERLPPGCRVTVLVFREGDQVNLNLFAEEEPEEAAKRLQENSITMEKMQELRTKMEKLSLQKKPKKPAPRVLSAKRPLLHNRRGTPRPLHHRKPKTPEISEPLQTKSQTNILQLPPIKPERNATSSATSLLEHSSSYLATSSLLQTQNLPQPRRNREIENRLLDNPSERDNLPPLHTNHLGRRRSQQPILPDILTSPIPISASKKVLHPIGSSGPLLDAKPRRSNDYGQGRRLSNCSLGGKLKSSREDLTSSSGNKGVSVLSTPNIAIVEEENDTTEVKDEAEFTVPANPIAVPSKEATTFTISQAPRERVTTAIGAGQNRFRVSRLIIDDNDRPKTSPDELTEHQKAAQGLCDILSESKWQRQRRRIHCSNSQLEMIGNFAKKESENEKSKSERKSTIDLTLPIQSSLIDMTIRSPRYGRRSVMLPSARTHDVVPEKLNFDTVSTAHTLEGRAGRQPRRKLSSSRGTIVHEASKILEELGNPNSSESHEPTSQSRTSSKRSSVRTRCAECKKRLNITNVYTCRCEKLFCASHRYSELHNCTFDYKTEGRKILEQTNPLVRAPKLPKI